MSTEKNENVQGAQKTDANEAKTSGAQSSSENKSAVWWEKWEDKLEKVVSQAVSMASEASRSPLAKTVKDQVDHIVNEKAPRAIKTAKRYASEVNTPHTFGMGMEVTTIEDLKIEAFLPHRWRNRSEKGSLHASALTSLAEFTSKTFWETSAKEFEVRMKLKEMQAHFLADSFRGVKAVMIVGEPEKKEKLAVLENTGVAVVPSTVQIFAKSDNKVAEFQISWELKTGVQVREVKNPEVVTQEANKEAVKEVSKDSEQSATKDTSKDAVKEAVKKAAADFDVVNETVKEAIAENTEKVVSHLKDKVAEKNEKKAKKTT